MKSHRIVEDLDVADVTFRILDDALKSRAEKIIAGYMKEGKPCFMPVKKASDVEDLQRLARERTIANVCFHVVTF